MKGRIFVRCSACKTTYEAMPAKKCCPRGTLSWGFLVDVRPDYGSASDRKQVRRTGFARKADAARALAELVTDTTRGTYVAPSKVTVAEYAATFLAAIDAQVKADSLAHNTASDYRRNLEARVLPHLGNVLLQELRPSHLTTLYGNLAETYAPKTISNTARTIHRMLEAAIDDGVIQGNVAKRAKGPKLDRTAPATLDADQLAMLVHHVVEHDPDSLALILIAATTGLRRGEIMGLRWRDLDLDAGTLRAEQQCTTEDGKVVLKRLKSKASRRTVELYGDVSGALRQHRTRQLEARLAAGDGWDDHDLVFPNEHGQPRPPKYLNRALTRTLAAAGLPHVTVHGLRHSFASVLLDRGHPIPAVSALLGHSSPAITLNVYAHKVQGSGRRAIDDLGGAIFGDTGTV